MALISRGKQLLFQIIWNLLDFYENQSEELYISWLFSWKYFYPELLHSAGKLLKVTLMLAVNA